MVLWSRATVGQSTRLGTFGGVERMWLYDDITPDSETLNPTYWIDEQPCASPFKKENSWIATCQKFQAVTTTGRKLDSRGRVCGGAPSPSQPTNL